MKIGPGADALFSNGHLRRALRFFVISHHRWRILHCSAIPETVEIPTKRPKRLRRKLRAIAATLKNVQEPDVWLPVSRYCEHQAKRDGADKDQPFRSPEFPVRASHEDPTETVISPSST